MYVVTRSDLSPGVRIAQSCHALRQFTAEHPEIDKHWFETSNYLVVLEAKNEIELEYLLDIADNKGIKTAVFREPDLYNEITAVTFEPSNASKQMLRKLPLAMKS